jgi:hypothetical protein
VRALSPVVVGFAAAALIGGYAASALGTGAGFNAVVAPLALVAVMAAFGWTRSGRDVLDVFGPSFLVAYAGFLGVALARVPHTSLPHANSWWSGPLIAAGPLSNLWPLVLVGGAIVALVLTIAVAVPVSLIPVRRTREPGANAEFFAFLDDRAKRR